MTKKDIAMNINHKADIARIIKTNYEIEFVEGEIYNNRGKIESWSDTERSTQAFNVENDGEYVYLITCKDVPCHLVDYNNEKECEILGAMDCEKEVEVLVLDTAIMRIDWVGSEYDVEEMGYKTIELSFEGFKVECEND